MRKHLSAVLLLIASLPAFGQATTATALPAPAKTGGMSLTESLATRRSVRNYASTPVTQLELSQLLWAAQGITDSKGHRTAPSARARYFLHLYLANSDGVFEYLPEGHKLQKLSVTDIRAKLSQQPQTASAPVVFIIAGDYPRATQGSTLEQGSRFVDLEAGHATQNLLLQATALSLAGVPMGGFDSEMVSKLLALPASSRPIYLVPVGHPK